MSGSRAITVQLVDDHEVVRIGFRYLLEADDLMQVVAESASGKQACRDYEKWLPDIVIMDISLPDISGLEVMRRILLAHPEARILMLSMHSGMVAERAMQMGARGFVCKRSGARLLISAIHEVMAGRRYLDDETGVQLPLLHSASETLKPLPSSLTRRELEVCLLLTDGRSVSDIAAALHLSEKTVYSHRQHIMEKLGVATMAELVQVATRMGILSGG
ncbi:response regulator [Mariprofundus ferrooxydans]|uniref:Regulatory protein, LuxR:Response regulator receiver n=1 Tax=Mariprofundus ferrooxydans PV-1 TaxID=314345 RepID=Q0EZ33_9PROT|nr:response regulator transcription factor [Mariprofundus ferrooxydans]EAU54591.1 regulatory protein, LuxR:Response regulator receiver [Mariprofundus ferrooxydans PV-1]KON48801.1 LuxR family transcriptional regulator [Mariprofundus ferrooxydans]